MSRAYYCTVKELNELGKENIPDQFKSNMHLIYSSPATLAFNSPGRRRIWCKACRACYSGFDHADRGAGLLWAKHIRDQLHA